MGTAYLSSKRPTEAAACFIVAAERNLPEAQVRIGLMLYHGAADKYTGRTAVPVKKAEAFRYFTQAARQGSETAALYASTMLYFGDGVPKDVKAAEQMTDSFKRAHGSVMDWVGEYIRADQRQAAKGAGPDSGLSRVLEAAAGGSGEAQLVAGHLYENALGGVPRDRARAKGFYESAEAMGYKLAARDFEPAREPVPATPLPAAAARVASLAPSRGATARP